MSSIAEEEWREYLVRRERELNRDVDDSTRPSGRFELVPKRQQSATLADDKRRALKGDGSFNLWALFICSDPHSGRFLLSTSCSGRATSTILLATLHDLLSLARIRYLVFER